MEKILKEFKYNRWLLFFIIIGLAAALSVVFTRHKVEEANKTVELAVDYEGLVELAEIEGASVADVLRQAKEAGINSLAVYETTLKKLNAAGKLGVTPGSELLRAYQSGGLSAPWRALVERGAVRAEDVYIAQRDALSFAETKEDLARRLGSERVQSFEVGDVPVLAIQANYEKVVKWNLGLSTQEMRAVNDAGFYVLARPSNYEKVTSDDIRAVFARLEQVRLSSIVFAGQEILGYPDLLNETAEACNARGLTLGMIEHPLQLQFFRQEGLIDLARAMQFHAARLYTIPKDEQLKMKMTDAVNRWLTTDDERNVRINLLRTFEKPEANMRLLETNMAYFSSVRQALAEKGYAFGKAGAYAPYYPPRLALALMAVGAAAAGVLYLTLLKPFAEKWQYLLLAALAAALTASILMGHGNTVRVAVALASANLFPVLAVVWQLDRAKAMRFDNKTPTYKIAALGFAALLATGVLSLTGAAYVGGVLADVEYLLEVHIYRGVKLTFVLPVLLVTLAFLRRYSLFDDAPDDAGHVVRQIKKALELPLKVKTFVGLCVVAVGAIVFVGRSGHTAGIPVPGIELKFRAFLEQALYARPRSKELLIGHPAFMLAVFSLYRKWPSWLFFALVVLATIGQGSAVETFAHIRTPVFMSFMRGVGGLLLGGMLGVVLMGFAQLVRRVSSTMAEADADE